MTGGRGGGWRNHSQCGEMDTTFRAETSTARQSDAGVDCAERGGGDGAGVTIEMDLDERGARRSGRFGAAATRGDLGMDITFRSCFSSFRSRLHTTLRAGEYAFRSCFSSFRSRSCTRSGWGFCVAGPGD